MRPLAKVLSGGTASALLLSALSFTASPAYANVPQVAYISSLIGNATVRRGDSGALETAGINAPLEVGDYLSTDSNARSEVQFDDGHVLRVAPNSQVRFAQLSQNDDTVQLASGNAGVGVVSLTPDYTQVQTPSVMVRPRAVGYYSVNVNPQDVTSINVRSGDALVLLPQGTKELGPGRTMLVWGPASNPSWRFVNQVAPTSFDEWNISRDNSFENSNAYQYVPTWMPGAYDLTGYGQWQPYPGYGNVWIPNDVPAGWSPYSNGQWTWEPYYGWTWVDYDPWGYTPFHYGRWFYDNLVNQWAWVPGSVSAPVQPWSPALVSFLGMLGGSDLGFGMNLINNVAWVPLAPSEPLYPWWGPDAYTAPSYTVVDNVVDPITVYRNARWPHAVRWMDRDDFAHDRYHRFGWASAAQLRNVAIIRNGLPVAPDPAALRYTQRNAGHVRAADPRSFRTFGAAPHSPATFTQQRKQVTAFVDRVHILPTHAPPRTVPAQQTAPRTNNFAAPRVQHQVTQPRAPQFAPQRVTAPRTNNFAAPRVQHQVAQPRAPQYTAPRMNTAPVMRQAPVQRAAPQERSIPQIRSAPQARSAPAPQARSAPAPQARSAPQSGDRRDHGGG